MSLASSPDYIFRPEDHHGFKSLFPSIEDPGDNFDEYFNDNFYTHSDDGSNRELSDALTDFLERKQSTDAGISFSSVTAPTKHTSSSPQPWRKGLWCMNQPAASDLTIPKTRRSLEQRQPSLKRKFDGTGKEAFTNPRSPPPTPSTKTITTRHYLTRPSITNVNPKFYAQQKPSSREPTLSPSLMYANLQPQTRVPPQDTLQQDFRNFHLRASKDVPLSPPLSSRVQQQQLHMRHPHVATPVQIEAAVPQHEYQNKYAFNHQLQTGVSGYPIQDPSLLSPSQIGQAISCPGEQAVYTSQYHLSSGNGIPTWTTESLESSDESQYSFESLPHLENSRFVQQAHPWQSPALRTNHIPMQQQQQYAQQPYYPIIAQPTPQRPAHQLIQQPAHFHAEGLGIHFSPSTALSPPMSNVNIMNPLQAYPPLPPPPTYAFTNEDPFSTPRRTRRKSSPLRSPSRCISPTDTSRTLRQRSPTHHVSSTRSRRKSVGNTGPITYTAPPPLPRTPKTPKTPKTPTGQGIMDFVNFTPKDSAKLLSDVAPSGSSKTRARREAEAREKRKRLSEAAVKAVTRAGGDIRVLKAEGLCLS